MCRVDVKPYYIIPFHDLMPLTTVLRTARRHAKWRLMLPGRRSSLKARSQVRLGRPVRWHRSARGRLMAAWRACGWSCDASARVPLIENWQSVGKWLKVSYKSHTLELARAACTRIGKKKLSYRSEGARRSMSLEIWDIRRRIINQSINQKRIRVTKVTNVTARPLLQC